MLWMCNWQNPECGKLKPTNQAASADKLWGKKKKCNRKLVDKKTNAYISKPHLVSDLSRLLKKRWENENELINLRKWNSD